MAMKWKVGTLILISLLSPLAALAYNSSTGLWQKINRNLSVELTSSRILDRQTVFYLTERSAEPGNPIDFNEYRCMTGEHRIVRSVQTINGKVQTTDKPNSPWLAYPSRHLTRILGRNVCQELKLLFVP